MIIQNLSFSYPKSSKELIKDLNLTFEKGVMNVVIGLNGAGKTTLFDIIIGQYKIDSGHIIDIPLAKDILYHVQGAYISFLVKGKDYIRLIYKISNKTNHKNYEGYISEMNFDERETELFKDLWDKKIGQMSVGERRWLYVTILSQIQRKLYIFDEPTAGVDPSSRIKIYKRLEGLIEDKNKILIISTHHLQELKSLNCRLILMHRGELKFHGSFSDFLLEADTDNPDEAFDFYVNNNYIKWESTR